jgi:hypothetical protein
VGLDKPTLDALKRLIPRGRVGGISADYYVSDEHSISDIVAE